jgi:sigma-B regulation protein RsbU (phosphoserine phosphatase)
LAFFNRYLLRMVVAERQTSRQLELAHNSLEEYSQTLEDKVAQRTAELDQANKVLEQEKQRMEEELALAGHIQASFMSRELPEVSGWQWAASLIPAWQTSGDFYDICPLGKDRYAILVADVVDKGVGAALFMALCWALVHTYASQHPDRPDLVAQKVNQRLFQDTHSGQFVTLFYGVLDARKGLLSYINAGHNPPYLFSPDEDRSAQPMQRSGVPLGIFQGISWETCSTRFRPGDLLVLYTDGVTEAENGVHELFGTNRLVSVVQENLRKSPRDIHEAIIHEVHDFAGGVSQGDDITLMVLARG